MKILTIGDVTSPGGVAHLKERLWAFRRENKIDFCIVNGENASLVTALSPEQAQDLLQSGADVISGGNHTLRNKALYPLLNDSDALLRPLNFPADVPGHGYTIKDCLGYRLMVVNAMGTMLIDPQLDSPYPYLDRLLAREAGRYDLAVLDFHAEATGEKVALGYAYDGLIHVIFGTHTHVPTADATILPNGTGYLSDIGMCGETGGVLGMDAAGVIRRMRTRLPEKFVAAKGAPLAQGAIFTVDPSKKVVTKIEQIAF